MLPTIPSATKSLEDSSEGLSDEDDLVSDEDQRIAELVVSAGRGMKGPENWGIIEELAKELGAATACSRPVADGAPDPTQHHFSS